ncbi:MAG: hypothetical protein IJK87_14065 [Prevotella sp.]|nr:hypothetical protein [Prevotella sp.]
MKKLDKTPLAKNREIEWRGETECPEISDKSGFSGRKYPFNIFCVASAGHRCHIRRPRRGHLRGAKVSEKMLKGGICRLRMPPSFPISLVINDIGESRKTGLFWPKYKLVANNATTEGQNVTIS